MQWLRDNLGFSSEFLGSLGFIHRHKIVVLLRQVGEDISHFSCKKSV